jgi:cytochrome c-type biogenesis protein CcmF
VVHFGIVLIFIGFTGNAFNRETQGQVTEGETVSIGPYTLLCEHLGEGETPNYSYLWADLAVTKNGKPLKTLKAEKRYYMSSEQPTSEVALHSTLAEDLYVVFAGIDDATGKTVIQIFLNPLVAWVWIGGIVLALGTVITILPDASEIRIGRRKKKLEKLLRTSERI